MLRIIAAIIISLGIAEGIFAQNSSYEKLTRLYQNKQYEECYQDASQAEKTPKILVIRALAFFRLPGDSKLKKEKDDPLIYILDLLKESNNSSSKTNWKDRDMLKDELRELQQTIFEKAEKRYKLGLKDRAEEYFDALHRTFDNSNSLFTNHYGFDDDHFLKTLRSNVIQEKQNRTYYSEEIEKLIDKHYFQQKDNLKKWDNPKYRLANTAKNEDYLMFEEKMIYRYLNMMRMNPDLFLETFIKPRLHVKYHGQIDVVIPLYDTLEVEKYNKPLTKEEFFNLPVHKIYMNELPKDVESKFIEKKLLHKNSRGQRFRYSINYTALYNYLQQNRPELLTLKKVSKFSMGKDGKGQIRYKQYDQNLKYYNKTYREETADSYYYQSLFKKLKNIKPKNIIRPDHQLFKTAECWAIEAGKHGLKSHDRIDCQPDYDAEACDYSNNNGFEVVLNLMVDKFVPSLGHRKALLDDFSKMGAAIRPHDSDMEYNAVLDFKR